MCQQASQWCISGKCLVKQMHCHLPRSTAPQAPSSNSSSHSSNSSSMHSRALLTIQGLYELYGKHQSLLHRLQPARLHLPVWHLHLQHCNAPQTYLTACCSALAHPQPEMTLSGPAAGGWAVHQCPAHQSGQVEVASNEEEQAALPANCPHTSCMLVLAVQCAKRTGSASNVTQQLLQLTTGRPACQQRQLRRQCVLHATRRIYQPAMPPPLPIRALQQRLQLQPPHVLPKRSRARPKQPSNPSGRSHLGPQPDLRTRTNKQNAALTSWA